MDYESNPHLREENGVRLLKTHAWYCHQMPMISLLPTVPEMQLLSGFKERGPNSRVRCVNRLCLIAIWERTCELVWDKLAQWWNGFIILELIYAEHCRFQVVPNHHVFHTAVQLPQEWVLCMPIAGMAATFGTNVWRIELSLVLPCWLVLWT